LTRLEIRPATAKDFAAMGRKVGKESVRAVAAELDGRTLGVAGLSLGMGITLFSDITEELRKYPIAIVRAGAEIRKLIYAQDRPVYSAAQDDNPLRNARFLEYLGGEYSHQWNGMAVYVWENE